MDAALTFQSAVVLLHVIQISSTNFVRSLRVDTDTFLARPTSSSVKASPRTPERHHGPEFRCTSRVNRGCADTSSTDIVFDAGKEVEEEDSLDCK
jgi:hypothetical protein